MAEILTWAGPLGQLLIAAAGVYVARNVGRNAAASSDRTVFTARREHAIGLATSDDEQRRVIGGLLIEELATSDLATDSELDTMGAISAALANGEFSSAGKPSEDDESAGNEGNA